MKQSVYHRGQKIKKSCVPCCNMAAVQSEVVIMRYKTRKLLSIFFILNIILTGICFDNFKTDHLQTASFSSERPARLQARSMHMPDTAACTAEMLAGSSVTVHQQAISDNKRSKEYTGLLIPVYCPSKECGPLPAFSMTAGFIPSDQNSNSAVLLCYIHDKDGKKKF